MSISISSHQLIRQRAYEIFVERGATGRKGDAVSDWLEAEQEIRMHRIPVAARMRHFAELPLKLSGFRPYSPRLVHLPTHPLETSSPMARRTAASSFSPRRW